MKTLIHVDPKTLTPHPLNLQFFGEIDTDPKLLESIKKFGVQNPVHVLSNYTILYGHRRTHHAIECGKETIPVIIRDDVVDDDLAELLLLCDNDPRDSRHLSEFDKARLFKSIKLRIERLRTRGIEDPHAGKRSSDVAAEQSGMSRSTAQRALQVVDAVEQLEEEGRIEEAKEIKEVMQVSVSAAARKAAEVKPPAPKRDPQSMPSQHKDLNIFDEFTTNLSKLERQCSEIYSLDDESEHAPVIMGLFTDIRRAIKGWKTDYAQSLRKSLLSPLGTGNRETASTE